MISKPALDLILESEGIDRPGKWPGAASGITLGHGYDLGYTSAAEFTRDWSPHLDAGVIARLTAAIGVKGERAHDMADRFSDIRIPAAAADAVFATATIPKWEKQTRAAFPGCELLPPDAFGALVSLTFNRGPGMDGDRRREMRAIRDAIAHFAGLNEDEHDSERPELLRTIAAQFRAMKRLWVGKGLDGLLRRRDAEARLVEHAA